MAAITFGDVIAQVLQHYFFNAIAFLVMSFIGVKIILKYNPYLGRNVRSILLLFPLFVPIIVYLFSFPAIAIQVTPNDALYGNFPLDMSTAIPIPLSVQNSLPQFQFSAEGSPQTSVLKGVFAPIITIPSIVGILCIVGIATAVTYFGLMTAFGHKLASRVFHVVELSKEEYAALQMQVCNISRKTGIKAPKIGIIEDLRPNAFTLGHGKNTMVVFSMGLLNSFSDEELTAIIAHEVAHIKARDFLFKTSCYSLNFLSFFNPLCYFVSSQAMRERELLADERGAKSLNQPHLMANVLIKMEKMLKAFPREHFTSQLSMSLFLISPLAHRPTMLAAHPQITCRVRNLLNPAPKLKFKPKKVLALSLVLIFMVISAGLLTIAIQSSFVPKNKVIFVLGAPDSVPKNASNAQSIIATSETGDILPIGLPSNSTFMFVVPEDSLPMDSGP
jgi:heat shock protein HtpX